MYFHLEAVTPKCTSGLASIAGGRRTIIVHGRCQFLQISTPEGRPERNARRGEGDNRRGYLFTLLAGIYTTSTSSPYQSKLPHQRHANALHFAYRKESMRKLLRIQGIFSCPSFLPSETSNHHIHEKYHNDRPRNTVL